MMGKHISDSRTMRNITYTRRLAARYCQAVARALQRRKSADKHR